jgi:hypothetical protein
MMLYYYAEQNRVQLCIFLPFVLGSVVCTSHLVDIFEICTVVIVAARPQKCCNHHIKNHTDRVDSATAADRLHFYFWISSVHDIKDNLSFAVVDV